MIKQVMEIARKAGDVILDIYQKDFTVEYKDDKSPLTEADKLSNEVIIAGLKELTPDISIISEENKLTDYSIRKNWDQCWLVDPIDGTKEFIKKNGEFTVNIAMIQQGEPVLSVLFVPAQDKMYHAEKDKGAFLVEQHKERKLNIRNLAVDGILKIVGSRSHQTPALLEYVEQQKQYFSNVEFVAAGSSIKFCLIAEGKADVYPRLGPTMEWDTAAGQLIATEAGAQVLIWNTLLSLTYNRENLLNPDFIVKHPDL
jgi:3'(2'), 5'-bisphosphate nucleotidase